MAQGVVFTVHIAGLRPVHAYNPYTGTYARGATAYGPYGSRSVGQAYNPYTGTYAATRQGSKSVWLLGPVRRISGKQIGLCPARFDCEWYCGIDPGFKRRSRSWRFDQVREHRRGENLQR